MSPIKKKTKGVQATILIIDDEPSILTLLDLMLNDEYDVLTCSEVIKAKQILKEHRVDLVILDYQMPVKTGLDFAVSIKPLYLNLQFMIITGHGVEEIQADTRTSCIDAILSKPFSDELLKKTVTKLLQK